MIKPLHECWWSQSRVTEVRYVASEGKFMASGISLSVVMTAFAEAREVAEIDWYSYAFGNAYAGVQENLYLVGADRRRLESGERQGYDAMRRKRYPDGDGPLNAVLQNTPLRFQEYRLRRQEADYFGVDLDNATTVGPDDSRAHYRLFLHDDCFANIAPVAVDDQVLRRLLLAVLQLHGHYLEREVIWADVLKAMASCLLENGKISLRSGRERAGVLIATGGEWINGRQTPTVPALFLDVSGERAVIRESV